MSDANDLLIGVLAGALRSSAYGAHVRGDKHSDHVRFDTYHGYLRYRYEECPSPSCEEANRLGRLVAERNASG